MGKSSERVQNLLMEVGSGKLAQDLKSKYKTTKSQFSRITKKNDKLSAVKDSLKNLKCNVKLNESLHRCISEESESKQLLNENAEKPAERIDDSTFFKSKGWINCFKRGKREQPQVPKLYNPSCSVEDYSNEIDLSANFADFKTTINNHQEPYQGILSRNLLKNVDDFYTWCEQQMDISTQDLQILKKLRNNAEEKLRALNN